VTTATLRCSACGIDWPPDFRDCDPCPLCCEPTEVIVCGGFQPVESREERSLRLHDQFERFYAARQEEDTT
jgi:hypothetical protein